MQPKLFSDSWAIPPKVRRTNAVLFPTMSLVVPAVNLWLAYFTQHSVTTIFGRPLHVVAYLALTVLAVVSWLLAPRQSQFRTLWLISYLFLFIWVITITRDILDHQPLSASWLTLVILVLALALKPPAVPSIKAAIYVAIGAAIVFTCMAAVAEITTTLDPPSQDPLRFFRPLDFMEYRWAGPFGSLIAAGFFGCFVAVVGLQVRGRVSAVALTCFGLIVILTSETRAAALSLVVACLCFFVAVGARRLRNRNATRMPSLNIFLALAVVVVCSLVLIANPDPNGRIEIWQSYLNVFQAWPLTGEGSSGITEQLLLAAREAEAGASPVIESSATPALLPANAVSGHNLIIDALARGGFLLALPTLLVVVLGVIVSIRALFRSNYLGPALVMSVLTIGLVDTGLEFTRWTVEDAVFLLGIIHCLRSVDDRACSKSAN